MCCEPLTGQVDGILSTPWVEQQKEIGWTLERGSFASLLQLRINVEFPFTDGRRYRRFHQNLKHVTVLRIKRTAPLRWLTNIEWIQFQRGADQCAMSIIWLRIIGQREYETNQVI